MLALHLTPKLEDQLSAKIFLILLADIDHISRMSLPYAELLKIIDSYLTVFLTVGFFF
jgi:hypothetical protein